MKIPFTETLNETSETVRDENYDDDVIEELDFKNEDVNGDSNYETHSDDEEQVTKLVEFKI